MPRANPQEPTDGWWRMLTPTRGVPAVLLAALLVGGCQGDSLDPGEEVTGPVVTLAPHSVALQAAAAERVELDEVATFRVTARALRGTLREVGVSARVTGAPGTPAAFILLGSREIAGATEVAENIAVSYREILSRLPAGFALPADGSLSLSPSAYAIHDSGACVAAVEPIQQQLPCTLQEGVRIASGVVAEPLSVRVVEGRTIPLPSGMLEIGDLLVHGASQRLFLSNPAAGTVEVLSLDDPGAGFASNVRVGSRPWGMALDAAGSQLVVANSGGTNFSLLPLSTLQEERISIPRITLYQMEFSDEGILLEHFNYADRPRHLARDAAGRILYSAIATVAAPEGTIRAVERHPGTGAWESRLLFPEGLLVNTPPSENRAVTASDNTVAIANVDSMQMVMVQDGIGRRFATGEVIVFDHVPGQPQNSRASPPLMFVTEEQRADAMAFLRGPSFQSDIVIYEGYAWNIPESASMADPTHVAASGDRQWVAFGEGSDATVGRVVLWGAANPALSRVEDIRDIVNNVSDALGGVDLNHDGSRGVVRGEEGVYFFDRQLRLQGTGGSGLAGGAGVAWLPGSRPLDQQRVFAGTGRSSIQVLDASNFRVVREIPIRSSITGVLRAGPCRPGAGTDCIATVYGVTAEGILVVDIPG